jgi:hypothetical protein
VDSNIENLEMEGLWYFKEKDKPYFSETYMIEKNYAKAMRKEKHYY